VILFFITNTLTPDRRIAGMSGSFFFQRNFEKETKRKKKRMQKSNRRRTGINISLFIKKEEAQTSSFEIFRYKF